MKKKIYENDSNNKDINCIHIVMISGYIYDKSDNEKKKDNGTGNEEDW